MSIPGDAAHSFAIGRYTFCAAVHYIFFCGEGEPVHNFLKKIGLQDTVTFTRLDPEGYDRFSCPSAGLSFKIPSGLQKWSDRMIDRFPHHRAAIARSFRSSATWSASCAKCRFSSRGPTHFGFPCGSQPSWPTGPGRSSDCSTAWGCRQRSRPSWRRRSATWVYRRGEYRW